ncbi:hypothetical protein ElyMa_003510200 [Elysia marginata]|uniref:Uncharacterized protein n=1 Tax=Elysia marginata TaxID=1093978 RepID=A0AAV4EFV9_9GAST|nr:hypothetical protein ElyMa_003510200 [Elysia marginata]
MLVLLFLFTSFSNLMPITCMVSVVVVQSISLEPSSKVSRACGTGLLLLAVDQVVLTVKLKIPDVPYTMDINGTYFRQMSTGGRTKVLCIPPMGQCSLGLVQLEQKNCACISLHNETYTLVLRQVASLDMNGSVIDFVWRFNSSSLFISEDHYKVPPVTIACLGKSPLYVDPDSEDMFYVYLGAGVNGFFALIGFLALLFFFKKDMCGARTRCEKCFSPCCKCFWFLHGKFCFWVPYGYLREKLCFWNPFCKDKSDDSDSSGGSDDSDTASATTAAKTVTFNVD